MRSMKKIAFSLAVLSSLAFGYSDTVYQVQTHLSERGYHVGTPDGIIGRGTSRAIREYQQDNGLRVNGRVTNELLSSMGISGKSYTNTRSVSRSSSSYSRSTTENGGSSWNLGSGGSLVNNLKDGKYQIGFLAAWPAYGLSLKVDYNEKINLELVAAPMGTFSVYSLKANYYLSKERKYNTYAYASGGVAMYEYQDFSSYGYNVETKTETVPMFGAGVGLEWSWREFLGHDFPNLYSTIEFGYANMSFDYYNFGGFLYGGGIYYKF